MSEDYVGELQGHDVEILWLPESVFILCVFNVSILYRTGTPLSSWLCNRILA
jgi:hypothetical protein